MLNTPRTSLIAGLFLTATCLSSVGTARATNYLVIIADDMGVDKVGAYADDFPGYTDEAEYLPATPTLDALAASGVRFTRAWSNPVCSPTRAALQTGDYAFRSGVGRPVGDWSAGPDWSGYTMLADVMARAGYATGLFGKWHLGTQGSNGRTSWSTAGLYVGVVPNPVLAGYQAFSGAMNSSLESYTRWTKVRRVPGMTATQVSTETGYATHVEGHEATAWINAQRGSWMAMVSLNAPHASSGSFRYGDVDASCVTSEAIRECVEGERGEHGEHITCDQQRATYAGLVECLDTEVGDLLDNILPRVLDDTLIVFIGDNGTPHSVAEWRFADADLDGTDDADRGKESPYLTGVHVPMIVADGQNYAGDPTEDLVTAPGRDVDMGVHVMGLYQTILRSATGSYVRGVDSQTFGDCLTTTASNCGRRGDPTVYSEAFFPDPASPPSGMLGFAATVGSGDLVLTVVPGDDGSGGLCLSPALYDQSTDYWQTSPISDVAPLARMTALFDGIAPSWAAAYPWC